MSLIHRRKTRKIHDSALPLRIFFALFTSTIRLVFEDDVQSVDDTWDETEDREEDVDQDISTASALEEDT